MPSSQALWHRLAARCPIEIIFKVRIARARTRTTAFPFVLHGRHPIHDLLGGQLLLRNQRLIRRVLATSSLSILLSAIHRRTGIRILKAELRLRAGRHRIWKICYSVVTLHHFLSLEKFLSTRSTFDERCPNDTRWLSVYFCRSFVSRRGSSSSLASPTSAESKTRDCTHLSSRLYPCHRLPNLSLDRAKKTSENETTFPDNRSARSVGCSIHFRCHSRRTNSLLVSSYCPGDCFPPPPHRRCCH